MTDQFGVCWQDTRLVFGPLNNVYQELIQYPDIVTLWENLPEEEPTLWLGQGGESALILQSQVNRPYGQTCYNVEIKRDILGYPQQITLR